jgi:hypothetical protein
MESAEMDEGWNGMVAARPGAVDCARRHGLGYRLQQRYLGGKLDENILRLRGPDWKQRVAGLSVYWTGRTMQATRSDAAL